MSIGIRIVSTCESGERDHRNSESCSGSPTRRWNWATIGAQYGGMLCDECPQVRGPTTSMAHRNTSGVKVAPTSAA